MDRKRRRIDSASRPRPHRRRNGRSNRGSRRDGYRPPALDNAAKATRKKKSRRLFSGKTVLALFVAFIAIETYLIATKSGFPTFDIPAIELATMPASDGNAPAPTATMSPLPELRPDSSQPEHDSPYGYSLGKTNRAAAPNMLADANAMVAQPLALPAEVKTPAPKLDLTMNVPETAVATKPEPPRLAPSNPGMEASPIANTRTAHARRKANKSRSPGAAPDLAASIGNIVAQAHPELATADNGDASGLEPIADTTPNTSQEVMKAMERVEEDVPLLGFTRGFMNKQVANDSTGPANRSAQAQQNPFAPKQQSANQQANTELDELFGAGLTSFDNLDGTNQPTPSATKTPVPDITPITDQVKNDMFGAPDMGSITQVEGAIVDDGNGMFQLAAPGQPFPGPSVSGVQVPADGLPPNASEFVTDPATGAPVLGQWDPIELGAQGYVDALPEISMDDSMDPQSAQWWLADIHGAPLLGRNPTNISLDELVVLALQAAPQLRVFAAQPVIERTQIKEAVAAFDWSRFLETAWNDTSDPVSTTLDAGGTALRLKNNIWTYSSGVRKLNRLGGSFETRTEFGHRNSNSTFLNPNNQGSSRLVLSYTQPLLNGGGKAVNESQIVLADLNAAIATNDTLSSTQNYILDVISAYWEVYFQRGQLAQSRRSYDRALAIAAKLNARKKIDADPQQIIRVKAAAATRRSAVINADTALKNAQDRLLSLVVGPAFTADASSELIPQDYPQLGNFFLEFDHEVQTALQMRPEVYITMNQLRSAAVNKSIARNDLLPRLDAFLETYVAGLRGDSDIFGAARDQFNQGEPGYSVGLRYEVPFGRRAAKARNERALLQVKQLEDQFQTVVADISVDVRTAVREIERLKADLMARNNALLRAIEELTYLEARYELKVDRDRTGSLYLEDLLGSQQRLFETESALLRTQADLAVALADLQRANGLLLRVEGQNTLPMNYCEIDAPMAGPIGLTDPMTGVPVQTAPISIPMDAVPMPQEMLPAVPSEGPSFINALSPTVHDGHLEADPFGAPPMNVPPAIPSSRSSSSSSQATCSQ